MVLHELGFVEDDARPIETGEFVDVETHHRVRGDDDIGACDRLGDWAFALLRSLPHRGHGQVRSELAGLEHPIGHHRGGGDHEKRNPRLRRVLIHVFDRGFGCGLSFALDPVVVDEV